MAEEKKVSEATENTEDEKKTASKVSKPKEKKPNVFKRFGKFLKECKSERKKIVWATLPSTVKNTIMVVVVIIICTAVLWGLDKLFQTAIIDWLGDLYRAIR
ncbi:MAG: preprotein translocase subunit SecE [Clostridia bacterium]|nr:preprotein translocase subunit SecE [Clostridia bacterium]